MTIEEQATEWPANEATAGFAVFDEEMGIRDRLIKF